MLEDISMEQLNRAFHIIMVASKTILTIVRTVGAEITAKAFAREVFIKQDRKVYRSNLTRNLVMFSVPTHLILSSTR